MSLLYGPRGTRFLMRESPLYLMGIAGRKACAPCRFDLIPDLVSRGRVTRVCHEGVSRGCVTRVCHEEASLGGWSGRPFLAGLRADATDARRTWWVLSETKYRGTSLIRNRAPLGPYSRNMSRALWWPSGGGLFLMSEVPLYADGVASLPPVEAVAT